jgi:hypothetical protein
LSPFGEQAKPQYRYRDSEILLAAMSLSPGEKYRIKIRLILNVTKVNPSSGLVDRLLCGHAVMSPGVIIQFNFFF